MHQPTIYWHDYETFGADPQRDRPAQFAGIRTDESLNIIGEPTVIYCQQSPDYLPSPTACLVTGITPQIANDKGVPEIDFMRVINDEFSKPKTCVAGYNSIRFDDEVTRHSLYRNLFDPYAREWQNRNSRWDIIDMVRLAHAVRPEGIEWPTNDNGHTSFKLELLTEANGIGHDAAHDALSDVHATIGLAKLVRERQPRLYDYVYQNRSKAQVNKLLDIERMEPLLHVSSRIPAELGCIALVVPLCRHPTNPNGVIVYDLRQDPGSWISLDPETIKERIFTPTADMEAGVERIPLKTVHVNRCPILVTRKVLDKERADLWKIDFERSERHREALRMAAGLSEKLAQVFTDNQMDQPGDPDLMLYSGPFFSNDDRQRLELIRTTQPDKLSGFSLRFDDSRLSEMVFRFKARNYPHLLDEEERTAWLRHCHNRLSDSEGEFRTYRQFCNELLQSKDENANKPAKMELLEKVGEYVNDLAYALSLH